MVDMMSETGAFDDSTRDSSPIFIIVGFRRQSGGLAPVEVTCVTDRAVARQFVEDDETVDELDAVACYRLEADCEGRIRRAPRLVDMRGDLDAGCLAPSVDWMDALLNPAG